MLRNWQILLAAFWFVAALAIGFREQLGFAGADSRQMTLCLGLSVMLMLWNLVRWFVARSSIKSQEGPLKPRLEENPKYEYNPELDFQKMEREKGG